MWLDPLDGQVLLLLPKTEFLQAFTSEMVKREETVASIQPSHQRFNKIQLNLLKNQNQMAKIQLLSKKAMEKEEEKKMNE